MVKWGTAYRRGPAGPPARGSTAGPGGGRRGAKTAGATPTTGCVTPPGGVGVERRRETYKSIRAKVIREPPEGCDFIWGSPIQNPAAPPGPPGSPRVDYIYPILYTNNYIYIIMTHFFIDIEYQTVNLVTPTTSARASQNIWCLRPCILAQPQFKAGW